MVFRSRHFECDQRPTVRSKFYRGDLHIEMIIGKSQSRDTQRADEVKEKPEVNHLQ